MSHPSQTSKIAVIVAGGVGVRMGADQPKQFLELDGKSILERTIETFLRSYADMQVILVLPQAHLEAGRESCQHVIGAERIRFTIGGETRFHSVQNGLQLIQEPAVVFVHDAVRCLLSISLIHRCFEQANRVGSAIPVIAATDSIRVMEGESSRSIPRSHVRLVQTPQTFRSELLLPAYDTDYRTEFTDEASVVEATGNAIHVIEGEPQNIKITSPMDLLVASEYLRSMHS